MISSSDLKSFGLDAEGLKKRFDLQEPEPKALALRRRWAARAQAGRDWNLANYKFFLAIDHTWDAGFQQTTQSLMSLLKDLTETKHHEDALRAAENWGITHMMTPDYDDKTGLPAGRKKTGSLPVMAHVILAIARSYTLQRSSRLVNERLNEPVFRFEPAYMTMKNRMKTEVLTQRVDQMSREFGYAQMVRQAIQYAAMYGHQLMFPMEEWWERADYSEGPQPGKEGVRFTLPHPSRTYFDLDSPMWTLNTNTGCTFAGYWRIVRWETIRLGGEWWNKDRVQINSRSLDPAWALYFNTTGQCRMTAWPMSGSSWFSKLDRQSMLDTQYYTRTMDDWPVWMTEHFEKINPAVDLDEKLPDTDLWLRVVLAADDTPIYVGPMNDRAVTAWMWEPLDNRSLQTSMVAELMPYQDHGTNILTQAILSLRQNLRNLTLYNEDILKPEDVDAMLKRPNDAYYTKNNYLSFSGKNASAVLNDRLDNMQHQVLWSYDFPRLDVSDHISMLRNLMDLMEKVVNMSAQDTGGTATHEQSAEELRVIEQGTGQRPALQGFDMDESMEGMKGVIYTQTMNNGSQSAYAWIDNSYTPEYLRSLGFIVEESDEGGTKVSAPLGNLRVDQFASHRDGSKRIPWSQIGNQMVQLVSTFMANPATSQMLPPEQLIGLINMSLEAMGLPRDFRLKGQSGMDQQNMKSWVHDQLGQLAGQAKNYINQSQQGLLQQLMGGVGGGGAGPAGGGPAPGLSVLPPPAAVSPGAGAPSPMPPMEEALPPQQTGPVPSPLMLPVR